MTVDAGTKLDSRVRPVRHEAASGSMTGTTPCRTEEGFRIVEQRGLEPSRSYDWAGPRVLHGLVPPV